MAGLHEWRGSIRLVHVLGLCFALTAIAFSCQQVRGEQPVAQSPTEMIALDFPPNLELKVLIQYVGDRLGINFLYDEQDVAQHITIVAPAQISKDSLLGLLESALKMKGLVVVDGDQPGWKRITLAANLKSVAAPTRRPMTPGILPAVAVTQIFTLRYADPQRADSVVKPFLTQSGGNTIPLPEQHLLIVSDYASTVQQIAKLIELIDQPPAAVATRFISVRNLDVASASTQLQQILAARDKALTGPSESVISSVQVLQDAHTNQLILIGPPDKVSEAEATAAALDVPLPLETRVYTLRSLSPDRLDRLVRETIDPLEIKRLYQSAIEKDSGMLIVTTTHAIQQKVVELIDQLDVPATEAASPIRFYKLTNTTAADVLATIRALEGGQEEEGEGAGGQNSAPTSPPQAGSPPLDQPGSQSSAPAYHDDLQTPSSGVTSAPNLSENVSPATGSIGGSSLNSLQPLVGVHTANAKITADPNTNTIIVEADAATQRLYEGLIKSLDKRRPQVLLECTLVTIDSAYSRSFGVELGGASVGGTKIVTFNSFGLSTPDPTTGALALTPAAGFNGTLIGSQVAQVVIQALQTDSHATVLSSPRILVNDNATGTLTSVDEQPFTSVNASTTVATTSFAGYASAGTTITLTPHISEGDHLQLEYVITLNSFSGQSSNGVPPPRETDSVQSKITIPDGSTVIVGGLNTTNDSFSRQTVPILGDIPILNYLLSQRNRTNSKSTLFVFIKPTILRDDQFADLKFLSEQDTRDAGLPPDYPQSDPLLIR